MMVFAGIGFIAGHEIMDLKPVFFAGKGGHQNVGSGNVFLPDGVVRGDPNPEFTPPFFIEDPGKYGWGIEAGKTAPFNIAVAGNQGRAGTISNQAVIQIFHSGSLLNRLFASLNLHLRRSEA
jgi:hypothetical protein